VIDLNEDDVFHFPEQEYNFPSISSYTTNGRSHLESSEGGDTYQNDTSHSSLSANQVLSPDRSQDPEEAKTQQSHRSLHGIRKQTVGQKIKKV
jgi:hypothetical protein